MILTGPARAGLWTAIAGCSSGVDSDGSVFNCNSDADTGPPKKQTSTEGWLQRGVAGAAAVVVAELSSAPSPTAAALAAAGAVPC